MSEWKNYSQFRDINLPKLIKLETTTITVVYVSENLEIISGMGKDSLTKIRYLCQFSFIGIFWQRMFYDFSWWI
jgi:hypothetical protein